MTSPRPDVAALGPAPAPSRLVAGLDLGGTKLLGVVLDAADPEGGPLLEHRLPTPRGEEAVVAALTEVTDVLVAGAATELGGAVTGLGVGMPGLVDRSGTLRTGPNLPGVLDLPVARVLGIRTGLPVTVDNDATCAVWGEHERGAARGHNHTLMVTLGTGIGTGITVKGEVLRGANGFAGESGHMIVDPVGPPCPCGRRGCWERYASGSGLGRLARDQAQAGRAHRVVEVAGGDPEAVRGEHVTRAAAEGDADALAVLEHFGWWVAVGVANLVAVLDSEVVVIGGGLVEAGDLVMGPTRRAFANLLLAAGHRPEVPILPAALGEHAGAMGAALLAAART